MYNCISLKSTILMINSKPKNDARAKYDLPEIIKDRKKLGILAKLKIVLKASTLLWKHLSTKEYTQKIHRLSVQTNETFELATIRIIQSGFRLLPTNADRLDFAGELSGVISVEATQPIEYIIKTNDGFTFNDWEGSKKQYAAYWLLKDLSPNHLKCPTFFAASSVYRSFRHGDCRVPGDQYLPVEGGTIIEAGAYVGYKTIAFGKRVGPKGKVLAIEIDRQNYELLEKNIIQNNMSEWVKCENTAIWNENTKMIQYGTNRMSNTIAKVDEKSSPEKITVDTMTLEKIFTKHGIEKINFLNLQLNGAEIEALMGLGVYWEKIDYVNIITRFKQDRIALTDKAKKIILANGGKIVVDERHGNFYNLTAKLIQS